MLGFALRRQPSRGQPSPRLSLRFACTAVAGMLAAAFAFTVLNGSGALSAPPMDRQPAGLTLLIKSVRSADGQVHVGVFDNADAFPRGDQIAGRRVAARMGMVEVTFTDLPAGRYAFAFYHDENSNAQFDKTLLGLPNEGFGFSNDAPLRLGPPSFADAVVDFDGTHLVTIAGMRYF